MQTNSNHFQFANLSWRQGQPYSSEFNDGYYSLHQHAQDISGLAESQYVFVQGNSLKSRFSALSHENFIVAETGFGTGLNFFATCLLWQNTHQGQGWLDYISIEKYPLRYSDMQDVANMYVQNWPQLQEIINAFVRQYHSLVPFIQTLIFPELKVRLHLIIDDVQNALNQYAFKANAWYLDGFAPTRNQSMWQEHTLALIAKHCSHEGTLATFTAAGEVRRGLEKHGFTVKKIAGFANKREMITASYANCADVNAIPPRRAKHPWRDYIDKHQTYNNRCLSDSENKCAIIGGGLSGSALAHALAPYFKVDIWDSAFADNNRHYTGNCPAHAIAYSRHYADDGALSKWNLQSYSHFLHTMEALPKQWQEKIWQPIGLLQNYSGQQAMERLLALRKNNTLDGIIQASSQQDNSVFYPDTGVVDSRQLCEFYTNAPSVTRNSANVTHIHQTKQGWVVCDGQQEKQYKHVIIASGVQSTDILQNIQMQNGMTPFAAKYDNIHQALLPFNIIGGQETCVRFAKPHGITSVICDNIYAIPLSTHTLSIGAGFYRQPHNLQPDYKKHQDNIKSAQAMLKNYPLNWDGIEITDSFVGQRVYTPDYLPYFGQLINAVEFCEHFYNGLKRDKNYYFDRNAHMQFENCMLPGLSIMTAMGARGVMSSALASYYLSMQIRQQQTVFSEHYRQALHPLRFLLKAIIRQKLEL